MHIFPESGELISKIREPLYLRAIFHLLDPSSRFVHPNAVLTPFLAALTGRDCTP